MVWIGVSILRSFLIVVFIITSLFSYDASTIKAKILSQIAHELVKKDIVNIYVEDNTLSKTKNLIPSIVYTTFDKADVVFLSTRKTLLMSSNKKYIFATSYNLYKTYPNILGVFFWQKGRPNIIIRSKIAKNKNIHFSKLFEKYIE